ncbi:fluoride efflux transporter CrcB [Aliidiomarina shirensis]|uniref:Fluoride-specific ion channel FluC n=1 Tax=Aliidiomarina shirensis TaxID=1048642 RepID=A0A432WWY7_9GAMM|nr:CrcB family protein [Aliidiomarina shirensis]RUO38298.1 fluoride efflux transporter CrcB [Aliidiomarina shirensis]
MMWLYIALGGALGAVSRYWLTRLSMWRFDSSIPATFGVNVVGAFLLGLVLALINVRSQQGLSPQAATHAFVFFEFGLLGGFTTFSTFILEFQSSLKEKPVRAFLYMNASVLVCAFAIAMGYFTVAGGYFG